jgi:hypothetical protein
LFPYVYKKVKKRPWKQSNSIVIPLILITKENERGMSWAVCLLVLTISEHKLKPTRPTSPINTSHPTARNLVWKEKLANGIHPVRNRLFTNRQNGKGDADAEARQPFNQCTES